VDSSVPFAVLEAGASPSAESSRQRPLPLWRLAKKPVAPWILSPSAPNLTPQTNGAERFIQNHLRNGLRDRLPKSNERNRWLPAILIYNGTGHMLSVAFTPQQCLSAF